MNYCAGAFGLGELYLDGLGVPQDIDKAIELYIITYCIIKQT